MLWVNLKVGLVRCHLKTKSKIFCLLFLVLPLVSVFSFSPLSEEEIQDLPLLTQEALTQIILIQNQLLTESDKGLIQLVVELNTLGMDYSLVQNQYQILLTTHQTDVDNAYDRGFENGAIIGNITGGLLGGISGFGLGRID